jgi:hypothetical protein
VLRDERGLLPGNIKLKIITNEEVGARRSSSSRKVKLVFLSGDA